MSNNFCGNSDITKIFIVEPGSQFTGDTVNGNLLVTGSLTVDGNIYNCGTGATFVDVLSACTDEITIASNTVPIQDDLINFGSPVRRFRNVNTVSGTSTVWTATGVVYTPVLDLGMDSSGNTRQITANNSIIQDDVLNGGNY